MKDNGSKIEAPNTEAVARRKQEESSLGGRGCNGCPNRTRDGQSLWRLKHRSRANVMGWVKDSLNGKFGEPTQTQVEDLLFDIFRDDPHYYTLLAILTDAEI